MSDMSLDLTAIRQANAARRARQAAATPGPWRDDNGYRVWAGDVLIASMKHNDNYPIAPSPADVEFIAAARADDAPAVIDQLVAEVERLRAGLAELRVEHHGARESECLGYSAGWCSCGAEEHNAKIAELLNG